MQMNRRMYLISRDKEFSNQFSVHFPINDSTSCCTANVVYTEKFCPKHWYISNHEVNPTQFLARFGLRNTD